MSERSFREPQCCLTVPDHPFKRRRQQSRLATANTRYPKSQQALYDQNAAQSPFLRLPAEVRNRIYEEALGTQVVHISVRDCPDEDPGAFNYCEYYRYTPSGTRRTDCLGFTHTVCLRPSDEEDEAYVLSRQPQFWHEDEPRVYSYPQRHKGCYGIIAGLKRAWYRDEDRSVHRFWDSDSHLTAKLPVALLATCRQVHKEAALIPYLANTFAFHELRTFNLFVQRGLLLPQRKALHSVQADGWYSKEETGANISAMTIKLLPGLKELRAWVMEMPGASYLGGSPFNAFAKLQLETVKVIYREDEKDGGLNRMQRVKRATEIERDIMER